MKTSESIKDISAALAKAQGAMGPVIKDKTAKVQMKAGGAYSFDYADLASVLDVVRPALAANGIAIVQTPSVHEGQVVVETRLAHASGEWMESALSTKAEDLSPQKIGSAITYLRRYSLSCMVGVASEEDDDGNAAEGNRAQTSTRTQAPPRSAAPTVVQAGILECIAAADPKDHLTMTALASRYRQMPEGPDKVAAHDALLVKSQAARSAS
jgi:ERF superfamily